MKKLLNILLIVLMAISAVSLVLVGVLGEPSGYLGVGLMLTWAYVLLGIAILAAVIFPLVNLAQNPKGAMRTLVGLGIVVVVVAISFALSSAEPITLGDGVLYNDVAGLRLTDAQLYTAYIALVAAIVVTILGEIRNSIK